MQQGDLRQRASVRGLEAIGSQYGLDRQAVQRRPGRPVGAEGVTTGFARAMILSEHSEHTPTFFVNGARISRRLRVRRPVQCLRAADRGRRARPRGRASCSSSAFAFGLPSLSSSRRVSGSSRANGIRRPERLRKSNRWKALRWVMAPNSAKRLRAGGMDDVIFAASGGRPPREPRRRRPGPSTIPTAPPGPVQRRPGAGGDPPAIDPEPARPTSNQRPRGAGAIVKLCSRRLDGGPDSRPWSARARSSD